MSQSNDEQSVLVTLRFCIALINTVIVLGGLALLAVATSAARAGLLAPAAFIGTCGLALLVTVAWVAWAAWSRPCPKASSPKDPSNMPPKAGN